MCTCGAPRDWNSTRYQYRTTPGKMAFLPANSFFTSSNLLMKKRTTWTGDSEAVHPGRYSRGAVVLVEAFALFRCRWELSPLAVVYMLFLGSEVADLGHVTMPRLPRPLDCSLASFGESIRSYCQLQLVTSHKREEKEEHEQHLLVGSSHKRGGARAY